MSIIPVLQRILNKGADGCHFRLNSIVEATLGLFERGEFLGAIAGLDDVSNEDFVTFVVHFLAEVMNGLQTFPRHMWRDNIGFLTRCPTLAPLLYYIQHTGDTSEIEDFVIHRTPLMTQAIAAAETGLIVEIAAQPQDFVGGEDGVAEGAVIAIVRLRSV